MLPDVPTVAEAGLPGFDYDGWFGLFAPAKIPRSVLRQLSAEVARILKLPDVSERILNQGAVPKPSSPDTLEKLLRAEIETRRKIFGAAGTRPD
jgi:tripartite-type tricarboxylate transporter receptor subunit TctC